jgi:hypothetical protein
MQSRYPRLTPEDAEPVIDAMPAQAQLSHPRASPRCRRDAKHHVHGSIRRRQKERSVTEAAASAAPAAGEGRPDLTHLHGCVCDGAHENRALRRMQLEVDACLAQEEAADRDMGCSGALRAQRVAEEKTRGHEQDPDQCPSSHWAAAIRTTRRRRSLTTPVRLTGGSRRDARDCQTARGLSCRSTRRTPAPTPEASPSRPSTG